MYEDLFLELSGKTRKGNNFALSTQSAEGYIQTITDAIRTNEIIKFDAGARYSAINLHSLRNLGTIEIRTMRGLTDSTQILDWMNLIHDFYRVSIKYQNPNDLLNAPLEDTVPEGMLKWFKLEKIKEVYNSNLSNALAISYAHKYRWDFNNKESDVRLDDQFVKWFMDKGGYSERQVLAFSTRDLNRHYKNFIRERYLKEPDKEAQVTELQPGTIRVREEDFWVINDDIEVV